MCLARLAGAAVQDQDLDHIVAARESLRLIDGGMASARNRRQLTIVRDGLKPHQKSSGEARDTIELLNLHSGRYAGTADLTALPGARPLPVPPSGR